ncbi:MAG TPA: thiamine pyrophosphate-dependent enzyme [Xanthobacteraceae bacterium]|nr:thiamine pyrophosphate-dependent enzyme [Xanthobacteraceae bacterium]
MKNHLDGGDAILEAIRDLKVEYILSSPGTEWSSIWEAMANQIHQGKPGPKFMDCWHETLAVDIACGYTLATGRMQAVLLHAGSGLLQGLMGVHGSLIAGVPMLVISGESVTFGEDPSLDPGRQWTDNLSIVGGPQRLVEPLVKFACQTASPHTIYQSIIRAGEMAQRTPVGPTYLSIPQETMMAGWTRPEKRQEVPAAPKLVSAPDDVKKVAELLAKARNPVVLTEAAGRDAEAFRALVALSDKIALPVVERPGAIFVNFPKDHPMHQGHDFNKFWNDTDLAIVINTRTPWYPPSKRPPNAIVVDIDEVPHRPYMAYQCHQADIYLEGDTTSVLTDLANALDAIRIDERSIAERRARLTASHDELANRRRARQAAARKKAPIDAIWLCAALNEAMPDDTIYLDEVTTHTNLLREHIALNKPQCLFTRQGGLGQGIGLSLGLKLANPDRPVVTLIGDGAFLYNPVLQGFGAARDFDLPIMVVIFNNKKYAAMQNMHKRLYPDGTAVETNTHFGTHINGPDYVKVIEAFGGYGEQVESPDDLVAALKRGYDATRKGRTALVDVVIA